MQIYPFSFSAYKAKPVGILMIFSNEIITMNALSFPAAWMMSAQEDRSNVERHHLTLLIMKFVNEIQLYYQKTQLPIPRITSSKLAYDNAKWIFEQTGAQIEFKEYFFLMLLNNRNELIGYYKLSEGGITGTVVDIRIAFAAILKSLSVAVIMLHNHPSGTLKPSVADKAITKKFADAGDLLDIKVLDHLIITSENYYSFADDGVL